MNLLETETRASSPSERVAVSLTLKITGEELMLFAGSLNETFQAVEEWEFHSRLGFTTDEARAIQSQITDILRQLGLRDESEASSDRSRRG